MNSKQIAGGLALLVVILVAGYLWWQQHTEPETMMPPVAIPTSPEPPVPPAIQHPIGVAPVEQTLPSLEASDKALARAFSAVVGDKAWRQFFLADRIVRRIVATVDNLPRKETPVNMWPVRPVGSWLETVTTGEVITLAPSNSRRYAKYVTLTQLINAEVLVEIYQRFYPLFQQAYVELGYPQGYFNDRLIVAIDDLLAAPELAEPPKLASIKIHYEYADPDLERRSAGQRIMLRIGTDNAHIVKSKLREIRRAVLGP